MNRARGSNDIGVNRARRYLMEGSFEMYLTVPLKRLYAYKVIMQRTLFQRCAHFSYCSVLSLGEKVNTLRMSQPDMGSFFTKLIYEIFWS